MKKIVYAALLVLGICMIVCSCEKEGSDADKGKLEGKWWYPVKGEEFFDGKVVRSESVEDSELYYKAFFEDGNCTCYDLEDGETYVLPYSFIDNVINITVMWWTMKLHVNKLTNKEGVVDIYVFEDNYQSLPDDLSVGKVVASYGGKDIYSNGGDYYDPFWYYDSKGKAVQCTYNERSEGERVWDEFEGRYVWKYSFDYFLDTSRVYFKAE